MRKSTKWALVGIGLLALSAVTIGVILVILISGSRVPGNAVLVVKVDGELADHDTRSPVEQAFGGEIDTLMETIESIGRAAKDRRVQGLYLKVRGLESGMAKTQELRAALSEFRASGKPVVAHVEIASNRAYYLASVADELYLSPGGVLFVTGLLADASFYKGTLDKLKIKAELEHIGEYKSASEVWTRDSMSDPQREVTNSILDSLYTRMVDDIAASRKVTPAEIRKAIDTGFMAPEEAKSLKLVDDLRYEDQVEDALKERFGSYSDVRIRDYKKRGGFALGRRHRIAVVNAQGPIVSGRSGTSPFGEEFIGSESLSQVLRDLRRDDGIAAVVMRVNSPGGSGIASDIIWRETRLLKDKKPFVVSMADVAGSGGYYIAMGADVIVAEPATITGSIGVITGKFNMRGFYEDWIGIHRDQIKRGENADIFSDYQGFTDAQRQRVRDHMTIFYRDFVQKAAAGRGKGEEEIERIAKGRIWSGEQAKELGLIDELGGLKDAIAIARDRAGIGKTEDVALELYPRRKSVFEMLSGREEAWSALSRIPGPIGRALADLDIRERIAREGIVCWMGTF